MRAGPSFFVVGNALFVVAFGVGGCARTNGADDRTRWIWDAPPSSSPVKQRAKRASSARLTTKSVGADYAKNLDTCLSGASPLLCNFDLLNAADRKRVEEKQYAANRKLCLADETRGLCQYDLLRDDDAKLVQDAAYQRNLSDCMAGYASSLCDRSALKPADLEAVDKVAYANNLRFCLSAYSSMCRRELLTGDDKRHIDQMHEAAKSPPIVTYQPAAGPPCEDDAACDASKAHTTPVKDDAKP